MIAARFITYDLERFTAELKTDITPDRIRELALKLKRLATELDDDTNWREVNEAKPEAQEVPA
jgi:hypothetical protein